MSNSSKFYLPQLDGLRFFAFFLVFIHHAPAANHFFNPHSWAYALTLKLHQYGWIGVDIFLCLSSFLLTVLLMIEHERTGNISIKQFFIRRALRIWPLYYLILILAFFVFPVYSFLTPHLHSATYQTYMQQHFIPYSLFLGNFSYAYFTSTLTLPISPLWTISLEEQFYLFWPILLFILLPKNKKWFFITLTSMLLLSILVRFYIIKNNIPYPAVWVFSLGRLDPFALGGLVAYFYLSPKSRFFLPPVLAIIFAMLLFKLAAGSAGIGSPHTIWLLFVVDLAACLLIYAALYSSLLKKFLSLKVLSWLGKISFGLYIFHDMMLNLTEVYVKKPLVDKFHLTDSFSLWLAMFFVAFLFTLTLATISYYRYEKFFLKFKNRFTVVASRPA